MQIAYLIHRGEEFEFVDGKRRYEGVCLWSWQEVQNELPKRISPIYIYAESIRRVDIYTNLFTGSKARKLSIAYQSKILLNSPDSNLTFEVVEF
jgi:hypothetical protein